MANDPKFCWNELETRDPKSAAGFYEEVLGWTAQAWDPEAPDRYLTLKAGDKVVAGVMNISDSRYDGIPNHWFAYIAVDDVDATCAKVEGAGGQIRWPPFDVPKVGRLAVIADSTGAVFGLIKPNESA